MTGVARQFQRGWLVLLIALLAGCTGPGLLNGLDAVWGRSGAARVARGVPFGAHGLALDVWRPAGRATAPRPVIIFFYGGGWSSGTRHGYGFAARALAARGFVVVLPDVRKVPDVRFPAFLQDGADAVRWARDHVAALGGDPERIAIMGHSSGAYTVAMLALDTQWLRQAGVDPRVVRAAVGLSGPYDFYPFDARSAAEAMRGAPDPRLTQPIRFVHAGAPPMLLATGEADDTVRPRNAIALAAALRAVGAPVVLRQYPGIGHAAVVMALSRPFRGKAPVLDDAVTFILANDGRRP